MDDDTEVRDQTVEDKAEDLELQDEAATSAEARSCGSGGKRSKAKAGTSSRRLGVPGRPPGSLGVVETWSVETPCRDR